MLRFLFSLFEGLFFWITRPRIILLLILLLVIASVTWMYFGFPAAGLAIKNFVLKTLPQWYKLGTKLLLRLWPRLTQALMNSATKKYLRGAAVFITLHFLSKKDRLRLRELRDKVIIATRLHLWEKPKMWWKYLSRPNKIFLVAVIMAVIISVPSLHILGLLLIPLALVKKVVSVVFQFVVTRLGANTLVNTLQSRLVNLIYRVIPIDVMVRYKWKYLRNMVHRRRKIRSKSIEIGKKAKGVIRDNFANNRSKKFNHQPQKK